jgi:putative ABC transport system permease protein
MAWIDRHPKLQARTTAQFQASTEDYWVWGSGAGMALGFGAVLGLLVGCVIVAQTLYALTKEHLKELATLKAIGASRGEILRFVAWQAAFLAFSGGAIGVGLAFGVQALGARAGLAMVLSPDVVITGVGLVAAMCAGASITSVRAVLRLDPAEVFK